DPHRRTAAHRPAPEPLPVPIVAPVSPPLRPPPVPRPSGRTTAPRTTTLTSATGAPPRHHCWMHVSSLSSFRRGHQLPAGIPVGDMPHGLCLRVYTPIGDRQPGPT